MIGQQAVKTKLRLRSISFNFIPIWAFARQINVKIMAANQKPLPSADTQNLIEYFIHIKVENENQNTQVRDDIKRETVFEDVAIKKEPGSPEIKYSNTQDYVDIGETVLTQGHRAASEVAAPLGFIKEEHIDADDAQILEDGDVIRHAINKEVKLRPGTYTFIKTEEQINEGPSIKLKIEDSNTVSDIKEETCRLSELEMLKRQVASWRVILHRLPTHTAPTSTTTSGAVKINIETSCNGNKSDNKLRKDALQEGTEECEKPYKCTTCEFKTTKSNYLQTHVRIHTGEKPYKCRTCDFKTTQSYNLQIHMRIHTGEKPYQCERCDYKTTYSSHLKTHMRTHTGEKPYQCETCDFKTTYSSSLKKHIQTHTGERPYKCGTCDFKTAESYYLQTHMRIHTGEKPYKCRSCDFKTAQSHNLKTHMRIHTGEKPYQCKTCEYRTTQSSYLKTHMRTHTGEKPYQCESCDFKTSSSSYLKRHKLNHTFENI